MNPAKVLVEGPFAFVHLMHPQTKKEIILCADFHQNFGGCNTVGHLTHNAHILSFFEWVKSVARGLKPSHQTLDVFLEAEHKAPHIKGFGPEKGFIFWNAFNSFRELGCIDGSTQACVHNLKRLDITNLRVHAVDPREKLRAFDIAALGGRLEELMSNPARHHEIPGMLQRVEEAANDLYVTCQSMIQNGENFTAFLPPKSRRFFDNANDNRRFVQSCCDVWLRLSWFQGIYDDRPPDTVDTILHVLMEKSGQFLRILHEFRQSGNFGMLKTVAQSLNVLVYGLVIPSFLPIMDMYALSRFLKPYVGHCVYYAGADHTRNLGLVLMKYLGYELVNQSVPIFNPRPMSSQVQYPESYLRMTLAYWAGGGKYALLPENVVQWVKTPKGMAYETTHGEIRLVSTLRTYKFIQCQPAIDFGLDRKSVV